LCHHTPAMLDNIVSKGAIMPEPVSSTSGTETGVEEPVVEETLVEEVSIDGMCGVY